MKDAGWRARPADESFARRVWITRSARFEAYRRLRLKERYSTAATSFLSAYVIVAAIAPLVGSFGITGGQANLINFLIGSISILILVLSLLEHRRQYSKRADRLHRCGMEISNLYNEIEVLLKNGPGQARMSWQEARSRYASILNDFHDVNHEPIDYEMVQYRNAGDFGIPKPIARARQLKIWLRLYGAYFGLIVGPPVLFIWCTVG